MSEPTKLGELVEVDLREAWDHEAHSFTPWLADNLDSLSAVIGVRLELEGQEVAVDAFSADILARNLSDDSRVLIENQLEVTDHGHLGQVLTYLAGLDAQTVIWIAKGFRDAHLSAVKWLNDHTADPFAFFAVRVKVVRIGNSPLAPVFEVLARPNEWDRQLHAITRGSGQMSEVGQYRLKFWKHLAERHPQEEPPSATASQWHMVGDLAISQYVGKKEVGIFIRGPRGADAAEVYERLAPLADRLAGRLGVPIGSATDGNFFATRLSIDGTDPANLDRMADWLHENTERYKMALREVLAEDG